jgi:hypothetical protein
MASKKPATVNPFTEMNREINKYFGLSGAGRIKLSAAGSFLSMRLDDPEGLVSVKMAAAYAQMAGTFFMARGWVKHPRPMQGINYHAAGVVANWSWV